MALSWHEVETLMQPAGTPEVTLADIFPPRPAWWAEAACREPHPGADWFPSRPSSKAAEAARAVCAGCPARGPCLAYARAKQELVGIWAGTSWQERRGMCRD